MYQVITVLTFLITVIMAVNVIFSVSSFVQIRRKNAASVKTAVEEYKKAQNERFRMARRYTEWTAVNEPIVKEMRQIRRAGDLLQPIDELRSRTSDMQYWV